MPSSASSYAASAVHSPQLGLSNNDRVLVSTDRVLDSYPPSMQGACDAAVPLGRSAETLSMGQDLSGACVPLVGELEEEGVHVGIAHMVGRVAKA